MKINVTMLIIISYSKIFSVDLMSEEKDPRNIKAISLLWYNEKLWFDGFSLASLTIEILSEILKLISLTIKLLKYNNIFLIIVNLRRDFYTLRRDVRKIICSLKFFSNYWKKFSTCTQSIEMRKFQVLWIIFLFFLIKICLFFVHHQHIQHTKSRIFSFHWILF